MSTKIYDAYEYKGTLPELMKYLKGLQAERKSLMEARADKLVAAVGRKDAFEAVKSGESQFEMLWGLIQEDATVFLYKGRIFVMFFFGYETPIDPLARKGSAKWVDFHYQDQSDRPGGITERDWKSRRNIWYAILGGDGYGVPSECGLNYRLVSKSMMQSMVLRSKAGTKEG